MSVTHNLFKIALKNYKGKGLEIIKEYRAKGRYIAYSSCHPAKTHRVMRTIAALGQRHIVKARR